MKRINSIFNLIVVIGFCIFMFNCVTSYVIDSEDVDIYVVGNCPKDKTTTACYWKNGERIELSNEHSYASFIKVVKDNVYVCGGYKGTACYWKNGKKVDLMVTTGSQYYHTSSLSIVGDDVYVCGRIEKFLIELRETSASACYWKNGKRVDLTDVTDDSQYYYTSSICVDGDDVYVCGGINFWGNANGINTIACYWKNGVEITLGIGSTYGMVFSRSNNE